MDIRSYLSELQQQLNSGVAREHAYRPALKSLFESTGLVIAINDPQRSEHGNPDFIFQDKEYSKLIRGYGESKDINISLDVVEKSEQMRRYYGYSNLVLTNGLDFRFYRNGEKYFATSLGFLENNKIVVNDDNQLLFWGELKNFLQSPPEKIRSAVRLSEIMGGKARRIRENINLYLKKENNELNVEIEKIYKVIKDLLVNDLSTEKFADMYAQTLVYGLFIARYHDKTVENFTRQEARDLVPASNPFLRQFFDHIAGSQFDKRLAYIVDELCAVFQVSDIKTIIKQHFKQGSLLDEDIPTKDPIIHFYEDFLKEYDPEMKKKMGAYYTPIPVVRYMVRSVDDILKTEFGLPKGLADTSRIKRKVKNQGLNAVESIHRVQILDPAVGTATFLNELVKYIFESNFKGQEGRWSSYVDEELIPRLYGFELMMAPYTIAHLKLAMTLKELGYNKEFEKRLGIYLTNSLEEGVKRQLDLLTFGLQEAISKESQAAAEIKQNKPIMVVIGNPPYSVTSSNKGKFIQDLIKAYKKDLGERKINLDDDYIKFIRFAEDLIEKSGEGVVAMITNNSFIDGITHRQMRKHLAGTFNKIYIFDLHGSSKKNEKALDGGVDQNVFSIMQGVSINIFIKTKSDKKIAKVYHSEIFGKQKQKFEILNSNQFANTNWKELSPVAPDYFFVPKNFDLKIKYEKGFSINELFLKYNSGIQTKRDKLNYSFNDTELSLKMTDLLNLTDLELKKKYDLPNDGRDWTIAMARNDIRISTVDTSSILYHPFDIRRCLYTGKTKGLMAYPRSPLMKSMSKPNLSLLLVRNSRRGNVNNFFLSNTLVDKDAISPFDNVRFFPIYLYDIDGTRYSNFDSSIINKISKRLIGDFTNEDLLDYIYAILYSNNYRNKFRDFLKTDYPRIPYIKNSAIFKQLVEKGNKLRCLHLMEDLEGITFDTSFPVNGNDSVEKIEYKQNQVYINSEQFFGNVPETAWNFYIGGYQPAQKWLKDRKGRTLSSDEIEHYQKVIKVLIETDRVMKEIDQIDFM